MNNSIPTRRRSSKKTFLSILLLFILTATLILSRLSFLSPSWLYLCFCILALLFCINFALFHLAWNPYWKGKLTQPVQSALIAPMLPLTLSALLSLDPTEFEEFIGIVLAAMGMEYTHIQRIGGSGDHGADLYARNTFDLPIIVQCKRYASDNHVDSPDMQRFLGSVTHYRAVYGWFITTSSFTEPARAFAATHSICIRLLDGEQLVALI